jgi:hypothetical protein
MKLKTIEKVCKICNEPFCATVSEVNRGNANFCSISCAAKHNNANRALTPYEKFCKHCGNKFNTVVNTALYCSTRCKTKHTYKKRHNGFRYNEDYYALISSACELCGWKEASRDIHHIIPIAKNGTNDTTNLVTLCPNHHRMAHHNLISQEQLTKVASARTMSSPDSVKSGAEADLVIKEIALLLQ